MKKFNVIIPTIEVNSLLYKCTENFSNQSYTNFILSIVLENDKNLSNLKNFLNNRNIKHNILVTNETNMSKKRNIAVDSIESEYIAFIDSDAYPSTKWLEVGLNYLINPNLLIIGGPSGIPYTNEKESFLITNYAKRSFFCTANLSIRKYSDKNHFVDWLESCNLMLKKKTFLSIGGMNEKQYVSEDLELCQKINKKYGKGKILYAGNLIVHHKDRSIINFIKQRFVYGLYLDKVLIHSTFFGKLVSITPLIFLLVLNFCFFLFYKYQNFYYFITLFIFLSILLVYFDLKKFKIKPVFFIKVYFTIILANLSYVAGNFLLFFKFRKKLSKKIYSNSQS